MTEKNKIIFLTAILSVLMLCVNAQDFKFRAPLSKPVKTGFYTITVSPALSTHVQTDLADLRIMDEKGKPVPYIITTPAEIEDGQGFESYLISVSQSDSTSIFQIDRRATDTIDNLSIVFEDMDVKRRSLISGSNDMQRWYIIRENIILGESNEMFKDGKLFQSVVIPKTSYRYLRVSVNNQKTDPVNILKIGTSKPVIKAPYTGYQLTGNPAPKFSQTDSSDHRSYITIMQADAFHTDQIKINVSTPGLYTRTAALYYRIKDRAGRLQQYWAGDMKIASNLPDAHEVSKIRAKELLLVIENNDNPPLKISSIYTAQRSVSVTGYFEAGKAYSLFMDAPDAIEPQYDLQQFRDRIPAKTDTLSIGKIISAEISKPTSRRTLWIWAGIILGAVMLTLLTRNLLRDMQKEKIASSDHTD